MKQLLLLVLLAGCTPPADTPMKKTPPPSRITVTRIAVFADDLAYGNERGIYVINDSKTGTEWIGISGIGISAPCLDGKVVNEH